MDHIALFSITHRHITILIEHLNLFLGIFIMIVCVWNTITELHPYYANYSETGGLYKSRSDVSDAYEATPG